MRQNSRQSAHYCINIRRPFLSQIEAFFVLILCMWIKIAKIVYDNNYSTNRSNYFVSCPVGRTFPITPPGCPTFLPTPSPSSQTERHKMQLSHMVPYLTKLKQCIHIRNWWHAAFKGNSAEILSAGRPMFEMRFRSKENETFWNACIPAERTRGIQSANSMFYMFVSGWKQAPSLFNCLHQLYFLRIS